MTEKAPKTTKKAAKKVEYTKTEVYNTNGDLIREYTKDVHGKDFAKLAEMFAKKNKYGIITK